MNKLHTNWNNRGRLPRNLWIRGINTRYRINDDNLVERQSYPPGSNTPITVFGFLDSEDKFHELRSDGSENPYISAVGENFKLAVRNIRDMNHPQSDLLWAGNLKAYPHIQYVVYRHHFSRTESGLYYIVYDGRRQEFFSHSIEGDINTFRSGFNSITMHYTLWLLEEVGADIPLSGKWISQKEVIDFPRNMPLKPQQIGPNQYQPHRPTPIYQGGIKPVETMVMKIDTNMEVVDLETSAVCSALKKHCAFDAEWEIQYFDIDKKKLVTVTPHWNNATMMLNDLSNLCDGYAIFIAQDHIMMDMSHKRDWHGEPKLFYAGLSARVVV